jgi:hypothetical protein
LGFAASGEGPYRPPGKQGRFTEEQDISIAAAELAG